MNRLILTATMALASSIGTMSAVAQERGTHRDHAYYGDHYGAHYGGYYRDGHRRGHVHGPRFDHAPRIWVSPVRPDRDFRPYAVYPGPWLEYSYPLIEPAPVIVERVYESRRFYEAVPLPREERYEERSYAQITPPPPRPAPAPAPVPPPAPRMERYTLSATELFGFDQSTLRMPQPKLDEIAAVLARDPRIDDITITGYTDRIGSDAYNLKLSQRRADAVKRYLVAQNVEARRLTAIGRGKSNPVVQCSNPKQADLIRCLEPNRRVEVEQITVERRGR